MDFRISYFHLNQVALAFFRDDKSEISVMRNRLNRVCQVWSLLEKRKTHASLTIKEDISPEREMPFDGNHTVNLKTLIPLDSS